MIPANGSYPAVEARQHLYRGLAPRSGGQRPGSGRRRHSCEPVPAMPALRCSPWAPRRTLAPPWDRHCARRARPGIHRAGLWRSPRRAVRPNANPPSSGLLLRFRSGRTARRPPPTLPLACDTRPPTTVPGSGAEASSEPGCLAAPPTLSGLPVRGTGGRSHPPGLRDGAAREPCGGRLGPYAPCLRVHVCCRAVRPSTLLQACVGPYGRLWPTGSSGPVVPLSGALGRWTPQGPQSAVERRVFGRDVGTYGPYCGLPPSWRTRPPTLVGTPPPGPTRPSPGAVSRRFLQSHARGKPRAPQGVRGALADRPAPARASQASCELTGPAPYLGRRCLKGKDSGGPNRLTAG
jgi:hypothetical protein